MRKARSPSTTNCRAPAQAAAPARKAPATRRASPRKSSTTRSRASPRPKSIEAGRVNRISAAVLVDGIYSKNDKGEQVYQPRSKEEIDRIAALVRSAIGFDAKRGDQLEVVNLRFAEATPVNFNEPTGWMSMFQFTKDDIMRGAELGVMSLLGLIVLFMVVRPLVRRIVTPDMPRPRQCRWYRERRRCHRRHHHQYRRPQRRHRQPRGAGRHLQPHLDHDRHRQGTGTGPRSIGAESRRTRRQNPHEAVSIIRNWLHEDAA